MRFSHMVRGVFVGCVAALTFASAASATPTWSYFAGGDAGFNALSNNGSLERAVTEGRIGNNAVNGTWEQGIWQQGAVNLQVQGQFAWTNGSLTDWEIVYDGVSSITFTVGTQSISWGGMAGAFTDIFIRSRAATDSTMELVSLDLVGAGLGIGNLVSSGNGDVDYIRIENMGSNFGAFTLRGQSRMTWTGAAPTNSALAYQVKLTNVVPEPASLALAIPSLLLTVRRSRR